MRLKDSQQAQAIAEHNAEQLARELNVAREKVRISRTLYILVVRELYACITKIYLIFNFITCIEDCYNTGQ